MLELDLSALNLLPFVKSECGSDIEVSPMRCVTLDVETLQFIRASVSKSVQSCISTVINVFQAVVLFKKMLGSGRAQEYVQLHNKFANLRFKPRFDPIRIISNFERLIEDYGQQGTIFPSENVMTIFLQKIDGIYDFQSPMFTFYSTISALPSETATFEYVKDRFLALDHSKYCKRVEPTKSSSSNSAVKKPKTDEGDTSSIGKKNHNSGKYSKKKSGDETTKWSSTYTKEQLNRLKTMTPEEKKAARCTNCGLYFHSKSVCKHEGRVCFRCITMVGHEANSCPHKGTSSYNDLFDRPVLILVDSAASHHIVREKDFFF